MKSWAMLAALSLLAFAFQGARGLYDPDEGRYVNVALNMLDGGDFLVPRLNSGHEHYSKPPLTYWAIAASVQLFGRSEWAARLPNALAFVWTGLLVAWMGSMLGLANPERAGWIWGLSIVPVVAANIVTADTLLTLFVTAGVAAFVAAETRDSPRRARHFRTLMWVAFGLAFLTKGPPALLPLAATLAVRVADRGPRGLRHWVTWPGALAFLVLALGWFVAVTLRDPALAQYFLGYEFVERLFSATHDRNPGWRGLLQAYGLVVALALVPWILLPLFRGARAAARDPAAPATPQAGRRLGQRLVVAWFAVSMPVFLLSQSRMPLYLLPLVVPASLWLAMRTDHWPRLAGAYTAVWAVAWIAGLVALKGIGAQFDSSRDARGLALELAPRLSGAAVSHWVFVDSPARFGLRLYTDRPVQRASAAPAAEPGDRAHPPPPSGMCAALTAVSPSDVAQRPVFVVERARASTLAGALGRCAPGVAPWTLARTRDYVLLGVCGNGAPCPDTWSSPAPLRASAGR